MVPLLSRDDEESRQFRGLVGNLHEHLEHFHIYCGKGTEKRRITLTDVYLGTNSRAKRQSTEYGTTYSVVRGTEGQPHGQVTSSVKNRKDEVVLIFTQPKYDIEELKGHQQFKWSLSSGQQSTLKRLYRSVNPAIFADLTRYREDPIRVGAYSFTCTSEELFAGVVEVLYLMRCALFHGELVPSREAAACYEPAYHLLRRFLACIS